MTDKLDRFLSALGDVPVATDERTIKLKSRDFFWFSPVLKPQLEDKRAHAVVKPRDRAELKRVVALAAQHRVALTTRGGGTGNYGQCVPLDGGIVLDMTGLDRILKAVPGLVTVEAGKIMLDIDKELAPTGWELRTFPSTRASATIGGFVCGGTGGIGSCTWGHVLDPGAIQGMTLLTMEESPREVRLEGRDVLKAVHAYGTNGIVLDLDVVTAPRQPWAEAICAFDDLTRAATFAQAVMEDQIIAKKLVSVHAPGIAKYLKRVAPLVPEGKAFAILMVAEPQLATLRWRTAEHGGDMVYTRDAAAAEAAAFAHEGAMPPLYEYTWNHTTLHAIKADPNITYLQVLFPGGRNVERLAWAEKAFAGEILWHAEFQRRYDVATHSSLCLVRYESEARLLEIMDILQANGMKVSNPHIYTLEGKGWKKIAADQEGLKRENDPYFLLNPGRLPTLEAEARREAAE
jgi:FAD/FMN-containing dehydrogenase